MSEFGRPAAAARQRAEELLGSAKPSPDAAATTALEDQRRADDEKIKRLRALRLAKELEEAAGRKPRARQRRAVPAEAASGEPTLTFLIRAERKDEAGAPVSQWLKSAAPRPVWGAREIAMRFASESDARRVAAALRITGAWSVETA
jgi:hypothetical protein